jgi:hypothetical protein
VLDRVVQPFVLFPEDQLAWSSAIQQWLKKTGDGPSADNAGAHDKSSIQTDSSGFMNQLPGQCATRGRDSRAIPILRLPRAEIAILHQRVHAGQGLLCCLSERPLSFSFVYCAPYESVLQFL